MSRFLKGGNVSLSVTNIGAEDILPNTEEFGNSVTTSEPHLHMQHQRNNPMEMKFPVCAEGLPMKLTL